MSLIEDKAVGALAGAAVGDALGGATEGWTPEQIAERYGGPVTGIVPPYFADWRDARPVAPYHKGDGHITDDTLMTHALVDVYAKRRTHLDAYLVAEHLVPLLISEKRWVPELETSALLLQRIFLAEKWLVARLHYGHVDPREAGVGNIVNCGAAMYMVPVGIANAGDPIGAYAEAIDIAGAHQSSYGREAAGVFAAAVAAAMAPGATPADVFAAAVGVAHDGTRAALLAVEDGHERHGRRTRGETTGGDRTVRHGRTELPRAEHGRAPAVAYEVHRRTSGGARLRPRVRRRRPKRHPRRRQLRPGRRFDRGHGRRDHRRSPRCRRRPGAVAERGGRGQPHRHRAARSRDGRGPGRPARRGRTAGGGGPGRPVGTARRLD